MKFSNFIAFNRKRWVSFCTYVTQYFVVCILKEKSHIITVQNIQGGFNISVETNDTATQTDTGILDFNI